MAGQRGRDIGADVAIVGMGATFPSAPDTATFWRNIVAGVDAISDVPPSRWDPAVYYDPGSIGEPAESDRFYCRRGGFIDDLATFDPSLFDIMPAVVDGTAPDQFLALRATGEAIADAGGDDHLPDRARIGVIFGRGGYITAADTRLDQRVRTAHQLVSVLAELLPDMDEARLTTVRRAFQEQLGPERPEASVGLVPNFAASRVANSFDFHGPAYTVDAACASSLVAVELATQELASGRCDAVIAGAVHHCHDLTLWSTLTQLRALSPQQQIRPFDRHADGTLISEGTGVVLLKRLLDAERSGDRVYAVIRGVGVASDGRASSLMSPLTDGQVRAIEQAWRDAGLDPAAPAALGMLEGHGTATPAGDQVELTTLARVFGPPTGAEPPIGLGTVKSMIGHAMPASGIAGLIKAALAIHHGVRPPTLHIDEPHPAMASTRFRPIDVLEPWDREREGASLTPRRCAVNAFGFGGINAHIILEEPPTGGAGTLPGVLPARRDDADPLRGPDPHRAGAHSPDEHRAGAHSPDEQNPAGTTSAGPQAPRGAAPATRGGSPEAMLLLSGRTPGDLAQILEAGDDTLITRAQRGAHDDMAVCARQEFDDPEGAEPARRPQPCRLAIIDPTPRRLALARKVVARGRPWRGRSDVWFTQDPLLSDPTAKVAFVFPGFEPIFEPKVHDVADHFGLPDPGVNHGDDLIERALGIIAVGRLLAAALRELDIAPDVTAGHSLGEWTAMIVAEMYPPAAWDAFIESLRPDALTVPDVVYAALGCGADQATAAIDGISGVVVSHDNCPHQSVICGTEAGVAEALARVQRRGVLGQLMPFGSGFHSPMMEAHLEPVRASFDRLPLQPPAVPVWSATSAAPFPDAPEEIRDLVIRHLKEQVRFRSLTERMNAAGVRAFVQVGPGGLTGFLDDTLRNVDHLTIAAHPPGTSGLSGLAQLRRVAAAMWVEGREPRFDRLENEPAADATPVPIRNAPAEPSDAAAHSHPADAPLQATAPTTVPDSPLATPDAPIASHFPKFREMGVLESSDADSATTMRLDLGVPLIRLGDIAKRLISDEPGYPAGPGHPVEPGPAEQPGHPVDTSLTSSPEPPEPPPNQPHHPVDTSLTSSPEPPEPPRSRPGYPEQPSHPVKPGPAASPASRSRPGHPLRPGHPGAPGRPGAPLPTSSLGPPNPRGGDTGRADDPVLAEFETVLREAAGAARDVLDAWTSGPEIPAGGAQQSGGASVRRSNADEEVSPAGRNGDDDCGPTAGRSARQ